ncbi:ABC transporter ATP-binding protein [Roseateles koreensis]|uniref:ATP-binding cassette domain-containing protein n=1 Tax=Roseateles koreensis TaxID=2987526 RepID=A0ABT5KRC1_9BURK|nr:oligopeptide/dipeptide ABC transporter ATP-binding protein [Roseateles koreensis]MDC8785475.1 ATP-binding cassette domain-containing protein [Roseateles koreensis]
MSSPLHSRVTLENPALELKPSEARQPLVEVRDLVKTFDVSLPWLNRVIERKAREQVHAVDGVSFAIEQGKTFALVGESGCGKSTVARLLVGLYTPTSGTVSVGGADLFETLASPQAQTLRRRMQMIFQDPYASLNPRWTVQELVAEPLREHGLIRGANELRARVGELLRSVGLSEADAGKFAHQFSGGQRQRICIARALAAEPELLVCDEPTSALDVSVQAQVLNLMKDLQRQRGLSYLFISHNLAVVRHVADQIGVMYLGRLVEVADKRDLFSRPQHPYTRMLLDAIPDIHKAGRARAPVLGEVPNPLHPPTGCGFHPRCPHAQPRCSAERPAMTRLNGVQVACHAVQEGRLVPDTVPTR